MKLFAILVSMLMTVPALASDVSSCASDDYTSERINEDVPANERLDVFNTSDEVVGAIHFHQESGDMIALYLCGSNTGYYYAEGNVYEGEFTSFYNDEYDSVFEADEYDGKLEISVKAVYFSGDPEGADYEPFSASLYVNIPEKK